MSDPYVAAQIRADLINAQNERNGGPDFEKAMKRYSAKYREQREENDRLRAALLQIEEHDGPGFPQGTCAKIASDALAYPQNSFVQQHPKNTPE